jgi:glycosyltransferase involved in cell wall biosynthesis
MVIVSNGHHKFITGIAAVEAERRGLLTAFITAGYPTPQVRRWLLRLGLTKGAKVARLLQRREDVADERVNALWLAELIYMAGRAVGGRFPALEDLADFGMHYYAWQAARLVERLPARIYHYRSGYGRDSVAAAKGKGMIALCDHSIAHPQVLDYLVDNEGHLPPSGHRARPGRIWRHVLEDIEQADHVLVNSDFVKETFIHCGFDPQRISVLYTGVDERFLSLVPARSFGERKPVRLMFAGDMGRRKGGRILLQALQRIRDLPWEFVAVGNIAPELRAEFAELFQDERVSVRGHLSWSELAQAMSEADLFVFPSLAEGSARVIFMAMACGCSIITTPNSGSVVREGEHGRVIALGDVEALERALRESLHDSTWVATSGRGNAELIRTRYTQRQYGEGLMHLYGELESGGRA